MIGGSTVLLGVLETCSHGLPASRFLISRWETSHTHSQSVSKTGQETGCFHFSKNKSVLSSLAHQGYAEPRAHRPSHSAQTVRVQPPAPEVPITGTRSWQPRMPRAAPGVPRSAAGLSPPRKLLWAARVPGAAPGVPRPGCRVGRDAMEIHISSVSRAYFERTYLGSAIS